jgi:hypothetical protein
VDEPGQGRRRPTVVAELILTFGMGGGAACVAYSE